MPSGMFFCPVDNEVFEQWATFAVICPKHKLQCTSKPNDVKPLRKPWIDPCTHDVPKFLRVFSACIGLDVSVCPRCGQNVGE